MKVNHVLEAKNVSAENLGYKQQEHKTSFEVEILGTSPPPWAWSATNIPCYLVAHMDFIHAKSLKKKKTNQYHPNHTSSIP